MQKEPDLDKAFVAVFKGRREDLGLSQCELADKAGVSQSWVSLVENAKRGKHVSFTVLRKISIALDFVSLSSFIHRIETVAYGPDILEQAEAFVHGLKEKDRHGKNQTERGNKNKPSR